MSKITLSTLLSFFLVSFIAVNIICSDILTSPVALLVVSLGSIALVTTLTRRRPVDTVALTLASLPASSTPLPTAVPVEPVTVNVDELQETEDRDFAVRGPEMIGNLKPLSRYSVGPVEMKSESDRKSVAGGKALSSVYPRVHEWARDLGRFLVDRVLSEIVSESKSIDQLVHSTAAMNGIVYMSPEEISRLQQQPPASLRVFSIGDLQLPRELHRLAEKIQRRKFLETYFQVPGVARTVVKSVFDRWLAEGRVDPDYMEDTAYSVDGERRRDERVLFHVLLTFIGSTSGDGLGIFRTSEAGGGYMYEGLTGSVLEVFAAAISKTSVSSIELRRLVQLWTQQPALPPSSR